MNPRRTLASAFVHGRTLSKVFISGSLTHESDVRLMAEQATQHDYVNVEGLHRIDRPTAGCEHFVGETLMQALRSVYSSCRIAVIAALCSESRPLWWNCCQPTITARTRNMAISQFPNSDAIHMSRDLRTINKERVI
jgi:hypothetical protein